MKLETKHLTPYLDYDIDCIVYKPANKHHNKIVRLKGIINKDCGLFTQNNYFLDEFKPILRPFSDLTKEITINEETFIPIYKLFELEYKGTTHFENIRKMYFTEVGRFIECSHYGTAMGTSINVLNPNENNYWKMQKLHEWHFDTNALINHNLAIDINTLP